MLVFCGLRWWQGFAMINQLLNTSLVLKKKALSVWQELPDKEPPCLKTSFHVVYLFLPRAHIREVVKQLVSSICQSVCQFHSHTTLRYQNITCTYYLPINTITPWIQATAPAANLENRHLCLIPVCTVSAVFEVDKSHSTIKFLTMWKQNLALVPPWQDLFTYPVTLSTAAGKHTNT